MKSRCLSPPIPLNPFIHPALSRSYLLFLQVADLVFEADETILYVRFIAVVGGGDLQVELQGAQPTGWAHLWVLLCFLPLLWVLRWGGDIQGRGRRQLHHVELHTERRGIHFRCQNTDGEPCCFCAMQLQQRKDTAGANLIVSIKMEMDSAQFGQPPTPWRCIYTGHWTADGWMNHESSRSRKQRLKNTHNTNSMHGKNCYNVDILA